MAEIRDFIYQRDFLPAADCVKLIACFERNHDQLFRNPQGDPFWDNLVTFDDPDGPTDLVARLDDGEA